MEIQKQEHMEKNDIKSMLAVLLAALCFSTGGILVKLIPWSPVAINGARNLIGALIVGIFLLVTRHRIKISKSVIIGAISTIGVTTCFIIANKLTTAANAIVLQYTAPVFVMVLMALIFHEKPGKKEILTCAAVFSGVFLFFLDGLKTGNLLGDLVAVLAGIFYAGVLMMNTAEDADALSSSFLGQLASGIIFTPLCIRETDFSAPVIAAVLILGAVQVGLAYVFLSVGIRRIKAITASFIMSLEPILNPVWVALFYGERISPLAAIAAVIIVGAIAMYNKASLTES